MITALDASVIDANSEAAGVGLPILMKNAGKAVVTVLSVKFPKSRIAIVCGTGNNGGDGIMAAKSLDPKRVTVFLLRPASEIRSEFVRRTLSELKCPIKDFSEFDGRKFDVLVDCALGTGIKGDIRPPYDLFIKTANTFRGTVVSVDVPSGLGTYMAVKPAITITFHDTKEGMNKDNSGEILVMDIGIPKEACDNVGPGDMLRYPIPAMDSHKGSNGKLLVIGGGPYYGAPAMAAMAAMRVGTDIVRLAVPENCAPVVATFCPVLMITELSGKTIRIVHLNQLLDLSRDFDAVLIGPGMGASPVTIGLIKEFVNSCKLPMVVDADGLSALGKDFVSFGRTILTPHIKEFQRLGGNPDRTIASVNELAAKTNSIILLKGMDDLISNGERCVTNATGNAGMTSAGTGDVLSGIVAGLLSKGMTCFDAAALGAFISGKAGELAFGEKSYGLIATDVIDAIPKILKQYLR